MKRKAVSVTVVTITKYTIIALFVLWELFGVVFGLHPELGSLPYLGELNTYYKEENGIPTIIFWINILWATILAGICTMLCLIIRTYIVRVLRVEIVKISWGKIYAIAATIGVIIVGIAIIGANNTPKHAIKKYYQALGNGDLEMCLEQVPGKLVQCEKENNSSEKADILELENVIRTRKDGSTDVDYSTLDAEDLYLTQQTEFFCAGDISVKMNRTEVETSSESVGVVYAKAYEEATGEKVTKVIRCKVKLSSDDTSDTADVWCVKIKGKWYCLSAMITVANMVY